MIAGARAREAGDLRIGDGSDVPRVEVLLVCSAGGHLLQLFLLRDAWAPFDVAWVTHDKEDARSLLAEERVFYAYGPTTRNLTNLVRNAFLACSLVSSLRPLAVVTTGAGIAVPFVWVARAFGSRVVYIESLTRIETPSLSCRLARLVTARTYVQWPEIAKRLRGSVFVGNVFGIR